jgi:hypothetical protein
MSFIDSFGVFFKLFNFEKNSLEECLLEVTNYCEELKDNESTVVMICRYEHFQNEDELGFWKKKDSFPFIFSLNENTKFQLFIDHTKKGNRHSLLIKHEDLHYILSSLANPFPMIQNNEWIHSSYQTLEVKSYKTDVNGVIKLAKQFNNLSWLNISPSFPFRTSILPSHILKLKKYLKTHQLK